MLLILLILIPGGWWSNSSHIVSKWVAQPPTRKPTANLSEWQSSWGNHGMISSFQILGPQKTRPQQKRHWNMETCGEAVGELQSCTHWGMQKDLFKLSLHIKSDFPHFPPIQPDKRLPFPPILSAGFFDLTINKEEIVLESINYRGDAWSSTSIVDVFLREPVLKRAADGIFFFGSPNSFFPLDFKQKGNDTFYTDATWHYLSRKKTDIYASELQEKKGHCKSNENHRWIKIIQHEQCDVWR